MTSKTKISAHLKRMYFNIHCYRVFVSHLPFHFNFVCERCFVSVAIWKVILSFTVLSSFRWFIAVFIINVVIISYSLPSHLLLYFLNLQFQKSWKRSKKTLVKIFPSQYALCLVMNSIWQKKMLKLF